LSKLVGSPTPIYRSEYTLLMRKWAALSFGTLMLGSAVPIRAQSAASESAYIVRGNQVEAHQHELKERLDRFYTSLSEQLQHEDPGLLAMLGPLLTTLKPPPPLAYGYQVLPRIIEDGPPGSVTKPHVATYSWPWSETLISREMMTLDRLQSDLATASKNPADGKRAAYEAIIAEYKKAVDRRRLIDADINYNWLWQRQIANDRPLFDRLTARLNVVVNQLGRSLPEKEPEESTIGPNPPDFVRVDQSTSRARIVIVPFYTDILDTTFVESFRRAIETHWHVYVDGNEYRVVLKITTIPPELLYCGTVDNREKRTPECFPPAQGAHINLEAHVAKFPADGAVLTTGAASLQLVADRAIELGPHDVAPRALAHEFGHVLGFPDVYLRGYKDLGVDGFEVMEFVPDYADIMMSPGAGSVLPRHFKALIAAMEIQDLMQAGLDALYKQGDPSEAATRFRQVLARNPDHYGATLQLAKALDRAGRPDEALPVWRKMLAMAEAANDAETLHTVRTRLAAAR